ncbi:hypothetical protein DAETH_01370 [Deinococcus aetherius]|uniref:Uncharacterized protein n=1 Tax=Deinococcus aetherius TaxID=200252 RepID=A0ABM8A8T8_9DEIO|nr:hypothetical protein [Deinococcus aetherius]BDP40168.1 hypothetical protein DAETH_01370 [Deinococcus aetherius]
MFEALARDLRAGTPADLTRAARRALVAAFLVLAVPGLPLGGLYLLTRPALLPAGWVAALVLLAAVLAAAGLHLARLAARDPARPGAQVALTAAMQAGTAPAVPFLLGCVFFQQPAALAVLWLVSALAFVLAWGSVPGWVKVAGER